MTTIDKPSLDHREYHSFTLESNQLKVLIVSDPKAEKSAAAMDVNVGHFSDAEIPGLAHFLEHMLFMGTKEHPGENEYSSYLAGNAGILILQKTAVTLTRLRARRIQTTTFR
jgi:insulysin